MKKYNLLNAAKEVILEAMSYFDCESYAEVIAGTYYIVECKN